MRKATALGAAALLVGSIASTDTHSSGLGMFAVAPDFNLGASLSFYNLVNAVGLDGSVYGWQTKQEDGRTRYEVGASLGLNAELFENLYPPASPRPSLAARPRGSCSTASRRSALSTTGNPLPSHPGERDRARGRPVGRRGEGAYVLLKCRRLSVTIGALRPAVLTVSHARARRLRSAAV